MLEFTETQKSYSPFPLRGQPLWWYRGCVRLCILLEDGKACDDTVASGGPHFVSGWKSFITVVMRTRSYFSNLNFPPNKLLTSGWGEGHFPSHPPCGQSNHEHSTMRFLPHTTNVHSFIPSFPHTSLSSTTPFLHSAIVLNTSTTTSISESQRYEYSIPSL